MSQDSHTDPIVWFAIRSKHDFQAEEHCQIGIILSDDLLADIEGDEREVENKVERVLVSGLL